MYNHDMPPRRRFPLFLVVFLAAIAVLFVYYRRESPPILDPDAKPRVVIPRGDLTDNERKTIELFKSASPSVVFISSIEMRRGLFSLNIYEIPRGTGSGFIWDHQGRIVTNYHVIGDASRVEVTLSDNSTWKAILVGAAPDKDLAVLQISAPAGRLSPINVGDSETLLVGQTVYAIGNPFGLDHTLTAGIVSALGREIKAVNGRTIQDVIQTDAAINPGNSGGPLLDSSGRLIGVNTAIYSPTGSSAGIGFAVPVATINRVVPQIIQHGKVIRPGLGVTLANRGIVEQLGIKGVLIVNVQPGSAAEKAGIRGTSRLLGGIVLGDIIVAVNGNKVEDYDELRNELDRYRIGDKVTLIVIREEQPIEIDVVLEEVS
ncbi:MAG: trypsin-like peptidase domain-containing protein [Desulfurivibrionaceae bacterium]|nr:trypsin-like peptidase domain-containing protein [Desulfobulbales bacterium]MDT8335429.1 trypsin-like peptidase domain-containing protein [Desulfurivibrionaceae bacterium]